MAKYKWPDGKGAVHSISWEQHLQSTLGPGGGAATTPAKANPQPWVVPGPDPATANPAPGAQPEPAPLPDPVFLAQQAAAQRQLQLGAVWDQYQLGQIENQYGLGSDVSNPFSQARLYQQEYQRQQSGTGNSYAARGLYNSGAYGAMRDYNAGNYAQKQDALQRQYQNAKAGVLQGQMSRYGSTIGDVSQQDLNSVIKALGALS